MDVITIEFGDRTIRDVWVPTRFVDRWHGMKRRTGAMLLAGWSVHGIGMNRPLTVVGLDPDGTVTAVRTLDPGRVVVLGGVSSILEIEESIPAPSIGSRARFYDRRHAGTTRGLRNAYRQSGRHLRAARRDAPNR
ncbi:MAG: hypothetical protein WD990_05465 [Acidimicrobiia bacterium]